jgi:hypothetical protein
MNGYEFHEAHFHAEGPRPGIGCAHPVKEQKADACRAAFGPQDEPVLGALISIFRGTVIKGDAKPFDSCEVFV